MNVLVTGGFGFVGSHLVELLMEEPGTRVHVVDNLSTSPIDHEAYLRQLRGRERVTYDICSMGEYFARADLPRYDEIYHLASVVGPVGVLKHAGRILRMMADDTYAVADYCIATGARLCDVSTSEVYGGGRDGYCSEQDSMIIPPKFSARLEYAVGKLASEVALMNLTRVTGLHATIVRPFNISGPRQGTGGGFVLPRFVEQALKDEPLTVYGEGASIRAFTHVRDIARGVILTQRKGASGRPYNMGNPANKVTILELARRVVEITGSRSEIGFVDPKKLWGELFEEANDKFPDSDRAEHELGWKPEFALDEIVRQTAEYIGAGRRD
jgi:UDP-glucose 4-epimerase